MESGPKTKTARLLRSAASHVGGVSLLAVVHILPYIPPARADPATVLWLWAQNCFKVVIIIRVGPAQLLIRYYQDYINGNSNNIVNDKWLLIKIFQSKAGRKLVFVSLGWPPTRSGWSQTNLLIYARPSIPVVDYWGGNTQPQALMCVQLCYFWW